MSNSQQQELQALYDTAFECIKGIIFTASHKMLLQKQNESTDGKLFKEQNQLELARDLYVKGIESFMAVE